MDDLLPSYESAIKQDPWELIARYLPSNDLCSAALVCQPWHKVVVPRLWGSPSSHFGVQNDTVYVALTRFKRTLYWARPSVRELTHTLQLPPAHAEIYGGPHSEWLRDCLERLPRLQCLIVNGLPFFDHASLLTLRHSSAWWRQTHSSIFPVFSLRLLDASACSNTTSTGLAEALSHFPDLVSLDLSRTFATKDDMVLSALKHLRNLRVLKLRGLGLKDVDFSIVASAIGTRVRCLDVSDNQLTDPSARLLLEHCMKETKYQNHAARSPLPPVRYSRPAGEIDDFSSENLDSHLYSKLTHGFVGSLAIEEARDVGITHLLISNNNMSVEGVSGLLRSERLQVLDVGTLTAALRNTQHPSLESDLKELPLPGVEKLTPVLAQCASKRLVYLRVNYTIITEDCPVDVVPSSRAELHGDLGVHTPVDGHELPAVESPHPEFDTDTGVYELPGDSSQPAELPAHFPVFADVAGLQNSHQIFGSGTPQTPFIAVTPESPEIKRGAAYAPEFVVVPDSPPAARTPVPDATGGLSPMSNPFGERGNVSPPDIEIAASSTVRSRHNSIYHVEDQRARLDLRQSHENRLHPGMLPKAHTLVLTDVPAKTDDGELIGRLIQFIKDCAEEVSIADLRATHTYMLPPGRTRKVAEREHARSLFALRRIVLEVVPQHMAPKKVTTSWRSYPTKSSTEDADSEAFWDAATQDFSFFGDEECGLPTAEPGRGPPLAFTGGLMLASERPAPAPERRIEAEVKPPLDVVSEIGKFRRERKAAHEAAMQFGENCTTGGYWPGDITVIRMPLDTNAGSLDYYGNRYESGWLYR